jgi:nicotinamide-nucleotide amidase
MSAPAAATGSFEALARAVLDACRARGIMLVTAESCTGGMIAAALTDIAGSSDVVDRGFVTYSNEAKMEMIGVSDATLEAFGAVSRETALEMAAGALAQSRAGIALSVTGIAGPGGGSPEKPVGLVWFGLAMPGRIPVAELRLFEDRGRAFIRGESVRTALQMALAALGAQPPGTP